MKPLLAVLILAALACCPAEAPGEVRLPAIFGDHMVVQRGMRVPIWGTAEPQERVTVSAAGQTQSTTTDETGTWRLALNPIEVDRPIEITVNGSNSITIRDVLVGEVWVCSGQSNMAFALKGAAGGAAAVKSADRPRIRLFTVGRSHPDQPQRELSGRWEICSPDTAADFSAVAYFFGLALQENLDRPIGLIEPSWGGTRAEAWMPRPVFDRMRLPYEPAWTEHWLHPKINPASTQPAKERPYQAPAALYNGMIAPIAGYAIRGVAWYQGETNTAYGEHYREVLAGLISGWREAWGQGDFPFLVVQLPNFRNSRFWPTLRAAQAQVARELPNVGLTVTIDIGNPDDAHPRDKRTVANRVALSARKIAYGQDILHCGPTFKALRCADDRAVITFQHVGEGLMHKTDALEGFEIAGADGQFVPADATIDGRDRVILRAADVPSPKAVRYGWSNAPTCTLYNSVDLPAEPFEARE